MTLASERYQDELRCTVRVNCSHYPGEGTEGSDKLGDGNPGRKNERQPLKRKVEDSSPNVI